MFKEAVAQKQKEQMYEDSFEPITDPKEFTRKRGTTDKSVQFKQAGIDYRQNLSEEEKEKEGEMSSLVVVETAIGNPKKSQKRMGAGKKYINSKRPCGYYIRLLADMDVPYAPLKEDCKDELDVQSPAKWVHHKAGECIALNIIETAIFASQPQFAGFFTGEGKVVKLSYNMSANRAEPFPSLKMVKGSIKENMPNAAEKSPDGNGWVVLPEFENVFGPLFREKKSTRRGTAQTPQYGDATKDTAASFQAYYKDKGLI